jgi:predicted kinase
MARGADASEADESVLDQQLQHAEPLDTTERAEAVIIDPGMVGDAEELVANLSARLGSV